MEQGEQERRELAPMADTRPRPTRPGWLTTRRAVLIGLGVAAVTMWGLAGWHLWALGVALAAVLLVRLVERFVPAGWRHISGPLVLVLIVGALAQLADSPWSWGIAAGLIAVAATAPRWRRWPPLAVALVLLVGSAVGHGVWQYQQDHKPLLTPEEHEYNVSQLRLREPRLFAQRLNASINVGDDWGVCFMFNDHARQQFTASVSGATSCEDAVQRLHDQIRDRRRYDYPSWDSDALHVDGKRATFDLCRVYWGDVFSGAVHDVGPKLGKLTLENPVGPGWIITDYQPCPPR